MKRKTYLSILLLSISVLSIIFMVGCDNGLSEDITLENGTVISIEKQVALEALSSDFEAFVSKFETSSAAKGITDEVDYNEAFIEEIKTFMKENLGDDYEKYIIIGEVELDKIDLTESDSRFSVQMNNATPYYYQATIEGKYCKLPWGTWGWGITSLYRGYNYTNSQGVSYIKYDLNVADYGIRTRFNDSVSSIDSGTKVASRAKATGNLHGGFFPNITCTTQHNVNDSSAGSLYRSYGWSTN